MCAVHRIRNRTLTAILLQGFLGLYGGLWATVSGGKCSRSLCVFFFRKLRKSGCTESLKNALKFMLKDQFAATAATIAGLVFA